MGAFPSLITLKVVVVEDQADLREVIVAFLGKQAHDVRGFDCADDLDEHLAKDWVDVLILDLNLPGEDGYSISERLRNAHPDIYIIMLTARTAVEDRVKGYASGADIYLDKPVSPIELQGSPGWRYLLELTHDAGVNAERAAAVLGRPSFAVDGQPVAEPGTTFQLTLPRPALGARTVVRLSIGGDLQIRRLTSPMVVHARIRLRGIASGSP